MRREFTAVPIPIIEAYVDYAPPIDFAGIVARLLQNIPAEYFVGLDTVVLCNLSGQSRKGRLGRFPRKGRRIKKADVAGLYHPKWKGQKAWVQLFTDKISIPPRYLRWIRPLPELAVGVVLFHELGHHAHRLRPEYREKEIVADKWTSRFSIHYIKTRYWYLYPFLSFAVWVHRKTRPWAAKQTACCASACARHSDSSRPLSGTRSFRASLLR